jgi:AcrR family transcriptional regulator
MYGKGGRVPKQVDHEERRRQLADALWRITAREGIEGASVRQVAQEANVSPGLVQHYFSTKDELLLFAIERIGARHAQQLVEKVGRLPEPRDPREVVRTILEARLPVDAAERLFVQVAVAWLGRAAVRPEMTHYLVEGTRTLVAAIAERIREGQASGRFAATLDPDRAAAGLLALTDGLAAQMLSGVHDAESAKAIIDDQLALLNRPK